ncbi:hypothetical protein E8E13_001266 [Curvularia kusanoi]|uniref:Uncharacterized protein n=1 Tax=Curvularia kusanoi TaxID=90978 RepID=A0A9P4W8Q8_CURKU|nr:hypothetical protein E8E13_001266 [Curvularia kusanoi]
MYSARRCTLLRGGTSYLTLLLLSTTILLLYLHRTHTLITSLSPSFPPSTTPHPPIPKIIWYKPSTPNGIPTSALEWTETCTTSNPDHEVLYLNEDDASDFVSTAFAQHPDILATWSALRLGAVKHDMLRYMLLYDQGGVWFDVGASCSAGVPISSWLPKEQRDATGLMLAREPDPAGAKPQDPPHRFATWVMMARPGSPHLLAVVQDIVAAVHQTMRFYDVGDVGNLTEGMVGDVGTFSGPGRLTRAVLGSLEAMLNRTVEREEVSSVLMPKLLGDVLIMPRSSFSKGESAAVAEGDELVPPALATLHEIAT